jgi:hypothetical protein
MFLNIPFFHDLYENSPASSTRFMIAQSTSFPGASKIPRAFKELFQATIRCHLQGD